MSKLIDTDFRNFGKETLGTHWIKWANCTKEIHTVQLKSLKLISDHRVCHGSVPIALHYQIRVLWVPNLRIKCNIQTWLLGHPGLADQVWKLKKLTVKLMTVFPNHTTIWTPPLWIKLTVNINISLKGNTTFGCVKESDCIKSPNLTNRAM